MKTRSSTWRRRRSIWMSPMTDALPGGFQFLSVREWVYQNFLKWSILCWEFIHFSKISDFCCYSEPKREFDRYETVRGRTIPEENRRFCHEQPKGGRSGKKANFIIQIELKFFSECVMWVMNILRVMIKIEKWVPEGQVQAECRLAQLEYARETSTIRLGWKGHWENQSESGKFWKVNYFLRNHNFLKDHNIWERYLKLM